MALTLAQHLPLEIVCMDSMQIYREMSIGTARPATEDMAGIPHHLYGFASVASPLNAAAWADAAQTLIAQIQARGNIPALVGGTGLYARALFEGFHHLPTTPPALRQRLDRRVEHKGKTWLHRLLKRLDPESAASLHPNDRQRVQRFLEVRILTGKGMHHHWRLQKEKGQINPSGIGLYVPRQILLQRIEQSVDSMLKAGWVEETQNLVEHELLDAVLAVGPIGYHAIREYLAGRTSYERMRDLAIVGTRQYAKRQMTWFRKVPYLQWFLYHPKTGYHVKDVLTFLNDRFGLRRRHRF